MVVELQSSQGFRDRTYVLRNAGIRHFGLGKNLNRCHPLNPQSFSYPLDRLFSSTFVQERHPELNSLQAIGFDFGGVFIRDAHVVCHRSLGRRRIESMAACKREARLRKESVLVQGIIFGLARVTKRLCANCEPTAP
jgi:hypothetical protein